jgi:hypothetical protein
VHATSERHLGTPLRNQENQQQEFDNVQFLFRLSLTPW